MAFPSIYSTTKLNFKDTFDLFLYAGDILTLKAYISGTDVVFGEISHLQTFSIKKIS